MASGLLLATDPPLPTTPERSLWGWLVAHRWRYRAVIAGMLLAYCLLGLGGSIISIDEGFYTQAAREMLARQSFWTLYLNGEPRYYKPPLAMWSIMASYALLGESDWAARLPSALLAGVVALLVLGLAWELFHDPQTNLLALLLFLLLPVTVVLSHMVMTDMYLLAGLAAGMYAWFRARRDWRWYGVFALGLGWGLLSKSVAALALPGWALVIGVVRREWRQLGGVVLASGVAMILALPWVMINLASSRPGFLHEALLQEIVQRILGEYGPWPPATWLGHLLYYPRVMFTDFLPWTVLLLVPMGRVFKDLFRREALGEQALGWWLVLPLVVYTLIPGKIDTYLFPVSLSVALLTARHLRLGAGWRWLGATVLLLLVLGVVVLAGAAVFVWYKGESQFLVPGLVMGLGGLGVGLVALWQLKTGLLLGCRDVLVAGMGIVTLATLATNPFDWSPDFMVFSQVSLPQLPVVLVQSTRSMVVPNQLLVVYYLRRPLPEWDLSVEAYLGRLPDLPSHVLVLDRFALEEIGPQVRYRLLAEGRKWRLMEVAGPAG